MNPKQKSFLIIILCGAITLIAVVFLFKELSAAYLQRSKLASVTQKIIAYQNNPIMKQALPTMNNNISTEQLLSTVKTCAEKNKIVIISSELKNENTTQGLNCQLQGDYLAFLTFLKFYTQQQLPYEINQFSISKNLDTVTIEIAFSRENITTKNHVS